MHFNSGTYGLQCMVLTWNRSTEYGKNAVTDEFDNSAPVLVYDVCHFFQIMVQTAEIFVCIHRIGNFCGTADIAHQYSKVDGFSTEFESIRCICYFPDDFITFIDESHVTVPQVRGMSGGDLARKTNLVEYGFRLPSAYDNRPLYFDEFESKLNQVIAVSATPSAYELDRSSQTVEQIIRPTGLLDPKISVRPIETQVDDLIGEIRVRAEKGERVLVTTLTKKMAEDLTEYLERQEIRVKYIHHNVESMERTELLRDLRLGLYDVLVGINLLREGIDLPEVTLVAILDADKEGFLRSEQSLIQTIGRAARNVGGEVIMYADTVTGSMKRAIDETERRRAIQQAYNEEHGITPTTIKKEVRELISIGTSADSKKSKKGARPTAEIPKDPTERREKIEELRAEMQKAARELRFEEAAYLRDRIKILESTK